MKRALRGFTLAEIMVVVSIITIIAVMAMISVSDAMKRARDTKRIETLKQYKLALETYRTDHPIVGYPATDNLRDIYPDYYPAAAPPGTRRFAVEDPLYRLITPPDTMADGSYYYNYLNDAAYAAHFAAYPTSKQYYLGTRLEFPNNDPATQCMPWGTMLCRFGTVSCPASDPGCANCNYCLTND